MPNNGYFDKELAVKGQLVQRGEHRSMTAILDNGRENWSLDVTSAAAFLSVSRYLKDTKILGLIYVLFMFTHRILVAF